MMRGMAVAIIYSASEQFDLDGKRAERTVLSRATQNTASKSDMITLASLKPEG